MGPLVGGWLVELWSWRLIFLTNVPVAAVIVWIALRHVPESRDPESVRGLDIRGAVLAATGLAGVSWALIDLGEQGASAASIAVGAAGVFLLLAFALSQRRSPHPMVPPQLFASRQFTGANLVTLAVYAALGGLFFLLFIHLQQVVGYSPVEAGLAALPVTGLLLILSARAGDLAERIGPRLPMTLGPGVIAAGLLLHIRIGPGADYLTVVLPAVAVFGFGLAITVAPLTATVLAAAEPRLVGTASGVNNAFARTAGLLAVAALPVVSGLTGDAYLEPAVFAAGFRKAMIISAALAAAGGLIAWLTIRNVLRGEREACPTSRLDRRYHCAVGSTPLATADEARTIAARATSAPIRDARP
jgi:predicted MFS family arabinose efflux permease